MSLLACSSSSSTLLSSPLYSKPLISSYRTPLSSNISFQSLPNFRNKPLNLFEHQNWRTKGSFWPSFLTKSQDDCERFKEELLEAIAPLDRGASATPKDQSRVDQIGQKLEAANKVKEPLKSKLLNGKWELLYTTSTSILQTGRPKLLRPNGKIYQAINVDTLRAQNMETWPFFNQATANLVPLNTKRVAVKFDTFKIFGLVDTYKVARKWAWSA